MELLDKAESFYVPANTTTGAVPSYYNYKLTNDNYNFIFKKLILFFYNIQIYSKYSNSLKNESCFNIMNIINPHASKMFTNNKKNIIELLQKAINEDRMAL